MFWQLALAATVLQLAFVFLFASQVVLRQQMVFSPASSVAASAGFAGVSGLPGVGEEPKETAWSSEPFVLGSRARALLVRHDTDLTNNWLSLEVTLIERNTGEAYEGVQELSHYKGVDDGESWSEGSPAGGMVFRSIPAGTYYLVVDYELGEDQPQAVAGTLEVVRNPAAWSNFVLLLVFLVVFPLFSRWRCAAFETRRWQESDLGEQAERDAGRQDDD